MLPCRPDGQDTDIAEKPSVGQDYARALGGGFQKHEGYLESDDRIVSWAIGHLVELAEPEDYDEALKRWSIKTLPGAPRASSSCGPTPAAGSSSTSSSG